jgi:hypothetical protein
VSFLRINSSYNIAQPLLLQPCQLPHRHISRVQDHPSEVRVAQVAVGEFAELGALLGYEADEGFGGNFWVGLLVILRMGFTLGLKLSRPWYMKEGGVDETYDALHFWEIFSKALNLDQLLALSVSLLAS